jgi:heptosyltransferase II
LTSLNKKTIKALIELPNWLGDCVMSTPALENIINYYSDIEITIIGSRSSIELIKSHPKVVKSIITNSKNKFSYTHYKNLGFFDIYFSFRGSIGAKIYKILINAKNKYQFNNNKFPKRHQVEKYVDFVNYSLNADFAADKLVSYLTSSKNKKTSKILGINPGASYGSAKRWYPEKFAEIAIKLSGSFDIIIFGGVNELDFASEIEDRLRSQNIQNFINLAGKTSISQLTSYIENLDIFITGDSGPMHLAASLQIPTIALFGPTNPKETSQWKNPHSYIVKKNLDCQPCMKRTCPLKHHQCMKLLEAREVIDLIYKVNIIKTEQKKN